MEDKHGVVGVGQQHFQKTVLERENQVFLQYLRPFPSVQGGQAMLTSGFSVALVNVVCSLPESRTPTNFCESAQFGKISSLTNWWFGISREALGKHLKFGESRQTQTLQASAYGWVPGSTICVPASAANLAG